MQTSEPDVRAMLRRHANAFSMRPEAPPVVERRVHRRRSRNAAFGAAALGSVGLVIALAVGVIGASKVPGDGREADPGVPQTSLTLVSYLLSDSQSGETGGDPDTELRDHVACMRAHGFDIGDPVRTPDGWTIAVDPSVVDVGSNAWREAAFVTCRLPLPASGNFILGLSKERVDRFVSCVSEHGFDLPEPALNDKGAYVFDLTVTDIDMNAPEWNRVAFVTCSPDVAP